LDEITKNFKRTLFPGNDAKNTCWSLGKHTKSQLQYNDFLVRVSNPQGTKSVEINNYLDQHIYTEILI